MSYFIDKFLSPGCSVGPKENGLLKIRCRVAAGYHAHAQANYCQNRVKSRTEFARGWVMGMQQKREAGDCNYGKQ